MSALDLGTPLGITLALLPEIVLSIGALIVLLVASWRHATAGDSRLAGWLALLAVLASGVALGVQWAGGAAAVGLPQMVAVDTFRFGTNAVFLLTAGVTVALSLGYVEREEMIAPEYYCLLLLATAGMMFLGGASDLIVLFLGLEVMSVAVYVLTGFDRKSVFSAEAALKYFLIGAFASGFLLYGIALAYGATGTTNLALIGTQFSAGGTPLLGSLGLGLLLIGFGFKISAVPFHMWAPDAYDGAPTPITGFMATGVKAAGFVALVRVLMVGFGSAADLWQPIVAILAIATMVVGNVAALVQRSLKRMLAYSSIAHAGYLLVAVWPGSRLSAAAVLFYVAAYGITTLASFGLLGALGRRGERDVTLDDIAGLARARPWMAFGLSVCMLSLLGFPGTVGFVGKWFMLSSVVAEGQWILAVVLVVTSVVSAGYYLPVVMAVYMRPAPAETAAEPLLARAAAGVLAVSVAAILLFGVWPAEAIDVSFESARSLFEQALRLAGR